MTLQIEILNPKATKLLEDLQDLKLISIKKETGNLFFEEINKIRKKAGKNAPSVEEITKEVELVRTKRYAKAR